MPHFKNGREAANGDHAITKVSWPTEHFVGGVINAINPNAASCDAQLNVITPGKVETVCVSLADCLRADDAWEAFDQLNSPPAVAYPAPPVNATEMPAPTT